MDNEGDAPTGGGGGGGGGDADEQQLRSPQRVIFLDVDGVLHPLLSTDEFQVHCLQLLQHIVECTSSVIVLSSSRRLFKTGLKRVSERLSEYSLRIYDVTPDFGRIDRRAEEICLWLNKQQPAVESFVVLDDMDVLLGVPEHIAQRLQASIVRTDRQRALTESDAQHAITMLQRPRVS